MFISAKIADGTINFRVENQVGLLFLDIQMPYMNGIEFLKAAWKARDFFSSRKEPAPNVPYLFVKSNGKLEKINFSDILFIKGMENYDTIHLTDKKVVTHITIKSFFEKLSAGQFIQTHKSYIVAIGKVDSVEGNSLHIGENTVQVSKSQRRSSVKADCKKAEMIANFIFVYWVPVECFC